MPCTDGGVPYPRSREEKLTDKMPAVLCGIMRVLPPFKDQMEMARHPVFAQLNWREAGVAPGELWDWWQMHKAEDDARRQREAQEQRRRRLVKQAKAKLSPEELAALKGEL